MTFLKPRLDLSLLLGGLVRSIFLAGNDPAGAATPSSIVEQKDLQAPIPIRSASLGQSVAISGDTLVAGAPYEGAAYVFVRVGVSWSHLRTLRPPVPEFSALFGWSVALTGNTLVVGAPGDVSDVKGVNGDVEAGGYAVSSGAAHVFLRSGANWTHQAYLKPSDTQEGDRFGTSVAVSEDMIAVGADQELTPTKEPDGSPFLDEEGNPILINASGTVYIFRRGGPSGNWSQQALLKPSNAESGDRFGFSVAVFGDTLIVGAPHEDGSFAGVQNTVIPTPEQRLNDASSSGAAYVFKGGGGGWTQQAYLKASNAGAGDNFGISVSLSSATAVVGAYGEDSGGELNGDQNNDDAKDSGAAYVYVRAAGLWTQEAYLKAPRPNVPDQHGDFFGGSVSISGDKIVVGASREDSATAGINGDGSNNGVVSAGAAYLFRRTGLPAVWSQQAYLKASNPQVAAYFGEAVGLAGDTIVCGASGFDKSGDVFESGAVYVFVGSLLPEPEIQVQHERGSPLVDGAAVVDFGVAVVSIRVEERSFTISNLGDAELTGLTASLDGPDRSNFGISVAPSASLATGGSTLMKVQLSDGGGHAGRQSAVLRLSSSDSDEAPFDIQLTGAIYRIPQDQCGLSEDCFLRWLVRCYEEPVSPAPTLQAPPADLPLGHFYALQSLMNQTEPGRRLTRLYREHTREMVLIGMAHPELVLELSEVLVDFQPALSALLAGKGKGAQITQPMIDQLNRAWAGVAKVASPALKNALETERARSDGFQAFAGKNFDQWAGLLQLPVPDRPYVHAFNPVQAAGQFSVRANSLAGMAYTLWRSAGAGAPWLPVSDAAIRLVPEGIELSDSHASPDALLYQVHAQEMAPGAVLN